MSKTFRIFNRFLILVVICCVFPNCHLDNIIDIINNPDNVSTPCPTYEWEYRTPAEVGFDVDKWDEWVNSMTLTGHESWGQNPEGNFGLVITKDGYIVAEFGDVDMTSQQSASVGKAFAGLTIQLAIDKGLLNSADDPIQDYWTGEGELDHPDKYMNQGLHQEITFRNLDEMRGGFPISNGWRWSNCQQVPAWADCSGSPRDDNFAHRPPGARHYSSGGRWRLHQALTKVIGTTMKEFLDQELFCKIGIKPEDWRIESGQVLHDSLGWYPNMPGYGLFCDPPYIIDGHEVQGGGGWVFMSAKDLAKIAQLVANQGVWNGEQVISNTDFLYDHDGGNGSSLWADPSTGIACGQVTTRGIKNTQNLSQYVLYISSAKLNNLLE
jgi:CubicO group peptidase (beta-lactamase class C family)